jgi:hypothetical protein
LCLSFMCRVYCSPVQTFEEKRKLSLKWMGDIEMDLRNIGVKRWRIKAKGLECLSHLIYTLRPCLIHTCHAMPMPRLCHAPTMPFFSRPRHSTAVERRPVGYLPAFGFFRLPRGVPRRLLSEAHHSSSQRSIHTYDCKEW